MCTLEKVVLYAILFDVKKLKFLLTEQIIYQTEVAIWRRKWQPTTLFLLGNHMGRGAWWATVHEVAKSWTRLKRLSCSSRGGNQACRS